MPRTLADDAIEYGLKIQTLPLRNGERFDLYVLAPRLYVRLHMSKRGRVLDYDTFEQEGHALHGWREALLIPMPTTN